jgi:lysophospholipid acyltransferase (LPLAT)-like uncharacterized protein
MLRAWQAILMAAIEIMVISLASITFRSTYIYGPYWSKMQRVFLVWHSRLFALASFYVNDMASLMVAHDKPSQLYTARNRQDRRGTELKMTDHP